MHNLIRTKSNFLKNNVPMGRLSYLVYGNGRRGVKYWITVKQYNKKGTHWRTPDWKCKIGASSSRKMRKRKRQACCKTGKYLLVQILTEGFLTISSSIHCSWFNFIMIFWRFPELGFLLYNCRWGGSNKKDNNHFSVLDHFGNLVLYMYHEWINKMNIIFEPRYTLSDLY